MMEFFSYMVCIMALEILVSLLLEQWLFTDYQSKEVDAYVLIHAGYWLVTFALIGGIFVSFPSFK